MAPIKAKEKAKNDLSPIAKNRPTPKRWNQAIVD
jgi:hypothetical protein